MKIYYGAAVITGRLLDDEHEVVHHGGVAVDDDRVVAVAPLSELRNRLDRKSVV